MFKKFIVLSFLLLSFQSFAQTTDYRAEFEKLDTALTNIEAGFQTTCKMESTSMAFCLGSPRTYGYCFFSAKYRCGDMKVKAKFKQKPNFNDGPEVELRKIKMTLKP